MFRTGWTLISRASIGRLIPVSLGSVNFAPLMLRRGVFNGPKKAVPAPEQRSMSLIEAAKVGALDPMVTALKSDISVASKNAALLAAVYHGQPRVMLLLIGAGAQLDACKQEITALMFAASQGHTACVEILLSLQAGRESLSKKDPFGRTALMFAAANGHAECIEKIASCSEGKAILNMKDGEGRSALEYAAIGDHQDCIVSLQQAGAAESVEQAVSLLTRYQGYRDQIRELQEKAATAESKEVTFHLFKKKP